MGTIGWSGGNKGSTPPGFDAGLSVIYSIFAIPFGIVGGALFGVFKFLEHTLYLGPKFIIEEFVLNGRRIGEGEWDWERRKMADRKKNELLERQKASGLTFVD